MKEIRNMNKILQQKLLKHYKNKQILKQVSKKELNKKLKSNIETMKLFSIQMIILRQIINVLKDKKLRKKQEDDSKVFPFYLLKEIKNSLNINILYR